MLKEARVCIEPTDIHATAGVSGALECLVFALKEGGVLEEGDGVLIPAPFWQGFWWCFEQRPKLRCVPVSLSRSDSPSYELTLEAVKDACNECARISSRPRLLVLTNPNNPLGVNYSQPLLETIYTWVLKDTEMHIVSDEIYANSQIAPAAPKFCSAFNLSVFSSQEHQPHERIHVMWGLGKDFGLSGFRVGFILSKSQMIRTAMRGDNDRVSMSWFSPLDSLKNVVIGRLFHAKASDSDSYPVQLMGQYKNTLTESYNQVCKALGCASISYLNKGTNNNSAQFFVLDLREYLDKVIQHWPNRDFGNDPELVLFPEIDRGEELLRQYLAAPRDEDRRGVSLLPGQTLSFPAPGYFRLCFTAYHCDTVLKAVTKIGAALQEMR